jgi:NTE family protein
MASSALPGPFTPLTIKNYPKSDCGYVEPEWVGAALSQHPEENLESYKWAQDVRFYEDAETRPYIHVFDGGISDNIGLRPLLFGFRTGLWNVLDEEKRFKAKRVILIVVDSKPADNFKLDERPAVPGLITFLNSAATKPMGNYSTATIKDFMIRFEENRKAGENYKAFQKLCDETHASGSDREACYSQFQFPFGGLHKPPYPDTYLIHVQFDAVQDPELKKRLGKIKTDLQLDKKDVDLLIEAGGTILKNSPNFKRLLQDLETQQNKTEG